jgi:hypothetical protein
MVPISRQLSRKKRQTMDNNVNESVKLLVGVNISFENIHVYMSFQIQIKQTLNLTDNIRNLPFTFNITSLPSEIPITQLSVSLILRFPDACLSRCRDASYTNFYENVLKINQNSNLTYQYGSNQYAINQIKLVGTDESAPGK